MSWTKQITQHAPSGRYAHASSLAANQLYIYGGDTAEGPSRYAHENVFIEAGCVIKGISRELYVLDIRTWIWRRILTHDYLPLYPERFSVLLYFVFFNIPCFAAYILRMTLVDSAILCRRWVITLLLLEVVGLRNTIHRLYMRLT